MAHSWTGAAKNAEASGKVLKLIPLLSNPPGLAGADKMIADEALRRSYSRATVCVCSDKSRLANRQGLDAQAAKTYVQTGSTTASSASSTGTTSGAMTNASIRGTAETQIHNIAIQSTQLLIVGDKYSYVVEDSVEKSTGPPLRGALGRAIANRKHGCRYIVGDNIQYSQTKNKLFIRDADGKECKLDIDRQERLQTVGK